MALIDYLNTQQPDNPPVEQDQQPIAPEQVQQNVAQMQPIVVKPEELSSIPDDEYAEMTKVMTPEQLVKVYGNYDPNSADPIYQTLYKATQRKPDVPEEKRIKATNTVAGITDALGMLVQGITGTKGGLVPVQTQTATQNNNAYVQRMRDLYRQENDRYNAGLFNAVMRDIELGRQGHQANRASLLNMLSEYRNRKYQSEREMARSERDAARDALRKEQYDADMAYKEKEFKENVRSNKANEAIRREQAAAAATRADAYATGQQTKGGGVPKGYVDYLDPNTNTYYRINEKKLKSFVPQMFKAMEQDIFRDNVSIKRRYDALTPNERLDFVMQNWPSSPAAVQYMEQLKDSKFSADPVTTEEKMINW